MLCFHKLLAYMFLTFVSHPGDFGTLKPLYIYKFQLTMKSNLGHDDILPAILY